ncbi:MAG: AAA family ATPase [Oscillospiraceae bacterium]|nr:AAA family ATPase [Oscillospiraceae bacterium]
MEKTAVILMGIQGSGKSTFYRTYLAQDFVRVNLDTLKTRHQERQLLDDCIRQKKSGSAMAEPLFYSFLIPQRTPLRRWQRP